jgi:urea transporter
MVFNFYLHQLHIIKHRKLTAFTLKTICLTSALVVLQNIFLHSDSSYADQLRPTVQTVLQNLSIYTRKLSDFWENGFSKVFRLVLFAAISGLAIIGYLTRVKKQITYFEIFLAFYLISVIIVPMNEGTRYLIPRFRSTFSTLFWA